MMTENKPDQIAILDDDEPTGGEFPHRRRMRRRPFRNLDP